MFKLQDIWSVISQESQNDQMPWF